MKLLDCVILLLCTGSLNNAISYESYDSFDSVDSHIIKIWNNEKSWKPAEKQLRTKKKSKIKKQWPTPEPTAWPTSGPTSWPTPEPTEWPTSEPTDKQWSKPRDKPRRKKKKKKWPTPEPTQLPTEWKKIKKKRKKKKKKWSTNEPTLTPTESPTAEPTEWKKKKKKKWPTPEPTKWPTYEPTSEPTEWKKKKKKKRKEKWPTPEPTSEPTEWKKKKKRWPTPQPSRWPTPEPTDWPTPEPTKWKTPEPTKKKKWKRTKRKSKARHYGCDEDLSDGNEMNYVLFMDASCGLTEDQSADYLAGVSEIIYSILDKNARIITIQFGATEYDVNVLIDLDDDKQADPEQYVKYIQKYGEVTKGGDGDTDLYAALKVAEQWLDSSKSSKWIIVSACKHSDGNICKTAKKEIRQNRVDVYAVNLINEADERENGIKNNADAQHYLLCLTNEDRVCLGNENKGVFVFDDVIDGCLLPDICKPN